MKKRIASLLLVLVMALSLIPTTVWADDTTADTPPEGATTLVGTFEELKQAVSGEATDIVVTQDIELTEELTISGSKKDITIRSQEGGTYKLFRSASFQPNESTYKSEYVFRLEDGKLTFQNIILDGNKEAVTAKNAFIRVSGSNDTQLTLGRGAIIQNCAEINGGAAVSVARGNLVMEEGSAIKDCTTSSRGGAIRLDCEPWTSSSTDAITLTMKGATISGCSTTGTNIKYTQGGAIYAYGRVTMDIQDSTIENNTANGNGGAIYGETSKNSGDITLNLSGTTITGNTSAELGGGVYFNGTTFTASGVTDITGNTGKGSSNNVYLAAGKTVSGSGLQEGSKVGISGANIPSTLVTGYADDSETGYFTADRTDTKLKATTGGGLELVGKEDHTHCICGRTDCQETGTGHGKITCKGVSSLDLIKTPGSYYLLNDVNLKDSGTWNPPSGVTLCLNGHAIHAKGSTAAINLEDSWGFRFDLTDCGTDGKITGNINAWDSVDEASGVIIGARATFNFYNGSICDNTLDSYQTGLKAGAVEANGTFNMYGGSIKNNQGTRWVGAESYYIGGVLVNSTGTFVFMGGEISGNRSAHDNRSSGTFNGGAVYVNGGKFKMTGGVIKNNRAGVGDDVQGDGGAVYIGAGGKFTMTGGEISGNTARRNGGGVAVVNGTFEMTGDAKISGNKAQMDYRHYEHKGGGVFVGASGTFAMSGNASVEGNLVRNGYSDSVAQGAGVYVSEGGTFTMSEKSSLKSNTMTSQYQSDAKNLYGGGVFVGGTLNLGGGSIEDNTAVYEGGGLYLDTKGTVNLGTGTIIVRNNTSEKTTGHNLYLPDAKKLIAPAGPADGSSITLSLPLARIQKAEGTAVIANTGKDIRNGDKRFAFEAEKITLVRDGDGEDVLAMIPAHTHADGTTYTPVYSLAEIPSNATGNYYLLQDSKMSGTVTVGANNTVNVCLNGHKSEPIYFKNSGTLNITDCKHGTATPGYITGYSYSSGSNNIETISGSTLNLTNVTVKEKTGSTFISATDATVNISGCEYSNNKSGFLVASTGSKVTVTDSTFKNNTMGVPTLWFTDKGATTGSFTVKNCTFTGNTNTYSNVNYETSRGCAINSGCPGTTLIENCTITGNTTTGDGGGIYLYGKGTATIKDCTVEDNEAKWHGGGIAVESTNAPVFTGKVVVKDNKSKIPYNVYYQDMTTVVRCNTFVRSGSTITTDSGFNANASSIGLSALDVPALVVSGNTSTKGFFVDDKDFVLRPTTSTSGPLLTSGNTGLELWHNGKGHTHCVCGTGENTADSTHTHENLNWIGVTELKDLPAGNYYLLRGYSEAWAPTKDINLCLNGLGISTGAGDNAIIDVDDGNKVAVTDCNESKPGTISGYGWYARDVYVKSGSTFTLWNGKLTGYDTDLSSSYNILSGGAVRMNGGKFVMNGGSISAYSKSGNGGVVDIYSGTFIMNAGSLSGKALNGSGGAVYNKYGVFTMNGGTITGKAAETAKDNGSRGVSGYGGAVYGEYATININGGTITGSSAAEGGGIFVKKSTLTIGKANITDNTAAKGGGGIYAYECAITIDGATITGNNGGDSLGGGVYISEAKGSGTTGDPYIPAVIQNATIQNNTAKCGGGISTSGPVKISDTTITGNTATTLENWGGGGLNARIIPKSSNSNGWVFELSGKVIITGNNAEGVDNNLYFPEVTAGTMLPSVTGLAAGSTIGVTTEVKPLNNGVISPVYITSDAGNLDYFTSDEGYVVKLDTDKNQLYLIAESSTVTVTLGDNMTLSSGDLKQTVLKNHPIADVTITADDGYYFPEGYAATLSKDGVTVTRDSLTQITISGTPTEDEVALILPAATAKTKPNAPTGLKGEAPTSKDGVDGKITGTTTAMEWSTDKENWSDCSDGATTVGAKGTYYVRIKATDTAYASDATEVEVPRYLQPVDFPKFSLEHNYDGTEKTLFVPEEGYDIDGDIKATDAGKYSVTLTLKDGYKWTTEPTSTTIDWLIIKRKAQAADFTFKAPTNLVWDGKVKTADITLNKPMTLGGSNLTVVYKMNDEEVAEPTNPGIYKVYVRILGDGTGKGNFMPIDSLTADNWTFEIKHPADHSWGNWQHDDTEHYRTCTVPGCTAEERAAHETDTPATCHEKAVCTVCKAEYGDFNAHNHTAVSNTAYQAPTCGSKGHQAYSHCADCGKYFSGKADDKNLYDDASHFDIDALNHKNVVKTDALAATCTVGGHEAYWQCSDCKQYFADNNGKADLTKSFVDVSKFDTNALGHDYTRKVVDAEHLKNAATCTKGAEYVYTCSRCDDHNTDKTFVSGNPLGHDFTEKLADKNHLKAAATCTKAAEYYYDCSRCDEHSTDKYFSNGNPLGHDFTEKLADKDHLKTAATCTEPAVYYYDCSRCDVHSTSDTYSYGDPLGHDYTRKVVDAEHLKAAATCTKGAEYVYTCSRCDDHNTDKTFVNGNPLGHDFTEKLVDVSHLKNAATCTKAAEYYYDCSRCDEHSTDKYFSNGNPLGHDFTEKQADKDHLKTAATCTESAVYYYDCSRCDVHSTSDTYSYGDPLGHKYTNYVYNNDATYDADGTETAACDHDCGMTDTRTKEGSKLIDSEAPVVKGVENGKIYCLRVVVTVTDVNLDTVTLNGETVTLTDGKLTVNGMEGEQNLVATDRFGNTTTVAFTVNAQHTNDDGVVTTAPTAAAEGVKTFTCTVCGVETGTEPVAKIAPIIVEGIDSSCQSGSGEGLTFRSNAAFADFIKVCVDGKELTADQYTVKEGSIVVTLSSAYLSTLSVGQHTLDVVSASGTATTRFTITAAPAVTPTGDSTQIAVWILLSAICALGALSALVVLRGRKRRNG